MSDSIAQYDLRPRSIAVVLGTRPEIVKLQGIIRILGDAAIVIHTGQHYDPNLSDVFFQELGIPQPDVHIGVGGSSRGNQIGAGTSALDEFLGSNDIDAVVVQGDTNAVAAGALAANSREVPLVHVEAGLRSFDRRMPEEHNRVLTDHLADLCCAPTETNRQNLLAESIPDSRIAVTGNTVVEAVQRLLPDASARKDLAAFYGVEVDRFILSTLHRPENVDDPSALKIILQELASLPLPVVLPLHPRSVARVDAFGLGDLLAKLIVTEPIGYSGFLGLGAASALVVCDSGGIQEEASVYKRPVLVVRRSTERPEVIGSFAERVEPGGGISRVVENWINDLEALHTRLATIPSPYGDGSASQNTANAMISLLHSTR